MSLQIKRILARALAAYVVFLPLWMESASAAGRSDETPAADHRMAIWESQGLRNIVGPTHRMSAANGFEMRAANGVYQHREHHHRGGAMVINSPWGESLELRYWAIHNGMALQFGDGVMMFVEQGPLGPPTSVGLRGAAGEEWIPIGNRPSQLAFGGNPAFTEADYRFAELLLADLSERKSQEFWSGLALFNEEIARVGCVGDGAICAGAVLLLAAAVGTALNVCIVGGAVVLTWPCMTAVLAYGGSWLAGELSSNVVYG